MPSKRAMTYRYKNIVLKSICGLLLAAIAGCIKNDLPYPRIQQNILAIEAVGELKPAVIDSANLTVTLSLSELVDIRAVNFSLFEITPEASATPNLAVGVHDFTRPVVVTVSRYQDYQWVVSAEQTIERWFRVEGQIGETVIDDVGKRVMLRVPETADLAGLQLTAVKLGPAGISTMIPDLQPGTIDLSRPLDVTVNCWGRSEEWTIYAEKSELTVITSRADAWAQVIWVYGEGPADAVNTFRYRRADSDEWITMDAADVTHNQGAFSAAIAHLEPLTEYVVAAVSGEDTGNEIRVTTESTRVLPDGSFDQWWLNGKVWCPWDENGERFWDTGNTGAATLGESNVQPSDHTPTGSGQSAMLETRFVGLFGIGKLAAGSIYTGSFRKVDGTNGILDFGRPWQQRPTKLKGYYQYTTAPIDYTSTELADLAGRPDSCHIYIALTDWTAPFEIRTNPRNRQLFDASSPSVIAYGELIRGSNTNGYEEFEIKLNYRYTDRVPTYIQITCAASKYGDYFTGGTGAILYVDQLSLDYDY